PPRRAPTAARLHRGSSASPTPSASGVPLGGASLPAAAPILPRRTSQTHTSALAVRLRASTGLGEATAPGSAAAAPAPLGTAPAAARPSAAAARPTAGASPYAPKSYQALLPHRLPSPAPRPPAWPR